MEEIIPLPQHIERIVSIGLSSFSMVNDLSSISVENSPFSICFSETTQKSFSDSVDVITVHFSSNFQVVVTEHNIVIVS